MEIRGLGAESQLGIEKPEAGGERFASALTEFIREVNQDQIEAANKVKNLIVDGKGSIHETMMARPRVTSLCRIKRHSGAARSGSTTCRTGRCPVIQRPDPSR